MNDPKPYTLEDLDRDLSPYGGARGDALAHYMGDLEPLRVLATVEALERVTLRAEKAERELGASRNIVTEQREDADRCIAALVRERDEARADAALLRIALENAEPIEAERDLLRAEVERLRGALEDVSLWLSHWRHAIVIRAEGAAQAWDELERIHNKAASFSARGEVRK